MKAQYSLEEKNDFVYITKVFSKQNPQELPSTNTVEIELK